MLRSCERERTTLWAGRSETHTQAVHVSTGQYRAGQVSTGQYRAVL
jgi:hypothetical protein